MRRLTVNRLKIDALTAAAKAENQRFEVLYFAMRDSDTPSDTGTSEPLPIH